MIAEALQHLAHPSADSSDDLRKKHPVSEVRWVPIGVVEVNDYNPNRVAQKEMKLLVTSILHDGYTQPIVTVRDEKAGKYVIVDGFHRYYSCKANKEIQAMTGGDGPDRRPGQGHQ